MGRKIIAASIGYTDPNTSPTANILYVATEGFITGSGDTPSDTWFQGRLLGDISYKWTVAAPFSGDKPSAGIGSLTITNHDGALDSVDSWEFRDGAVTLKMLDVGQNWSAGTTIAVMIVDTFSVDNINNIRLVLRDTSTILDRPFQDSIMGTGEVQPYTMGNPLSVSPRLNNAATRSYLTHEEINGSAALVRDNGKSVSFNVGTFGFKLLADPDGKITADATNANGTSFSNFVSSVTAKVGGLTEDGTSKNAIHSLGYSYAYYVSDDQITAAEILFNGCASHSGWYFINRVGDLAFGRLQEPDSSSTALVKDSNGTGYDVSHHVTESGGGTYKVALTVLDSAGTAYTIFTAPTNFTASDVIDVVTVKTDYARGLSDRMGALKNWTVLSLESIDPTIGDEDLRTELSREYKHEAQSSNTLHAAYAHALGAPPLPTYFVAEADANTEIDRLTEMYTKKRTFYTVDVAMDLDKFTSMDLGDTVTMDLNRIGIGSDLFDSGFSNGFAVRGSDKYLLMGIEGNFTQNKMRLNVWG